MLVISSSAPPVHEFVFKDRVSSSSFSTSSSSSFSPFSVVLRRNFFNRSDSSLLCCCSSKLRLMADTALPSSSSSSPSFSSSEAAAANSVEDEKSKISIKKENDSRLRTEEELISELKRESEMGRLPISIAAAMEELFHNYRNALEKMLQLKLHAFA